MLERIGKKLVMKDWFFQKVAREQGKRVMSDGIFGIIRETEKAYNVVLDQLGSKATIIWIPKSVVIEQDAEVENQTIKGEFEDVILLWKANASMYM